MTILFSTNIGGIEIKLRKDVTYKVATFSRTGYSVGRFATYAEASTALGNAIAHAIEQLYGAENLP